MLLKALIYLFVASFPSSPVIETNPGIIEIKKEDLLKKKTIYEIIATNRSCKVLQFNLIWLGKGDTAIEVVNNGDKLDSQTKDLIRRCAPGEYLYLEEINSLGDCLQYQNTGATSFEIRVK